MTRVVVVAVDDGRATRWCKASRRWRRYCCCCGCCSRNAAARPRTRRWKFVYFDDGALLSASSAVIPGIKFEERIYNVC